jgi:hypothetical protein
MEIIVSEKIVRVFDGLCYSLLGWQDHVVIGLKRCLLVNIDVREIQMVADAPMDNNWLQQTSNKRYQWLHTCYQLTILWRLLHGQFDDQLDPFNCRPIVCLKMMELFHCISVNQVKVAYATNSICKLVMEE